MVGVVSYIYFLGGCLKFLQLCKAPIETSNLVSGAYLGDPWRGFNHIAHTNHLYVVDVTFEVMTFHLLFDLYLSAKKIGN